MKLPKTLLAAIVVGIATQVATSCSKDKTEMPPKKLIKTENKGENPDNCPACGMG
jgi:hypothetical protein